MIQGAKILLVVLSGAALNAQHAVHSSTPSEKPVALLGNLGSLLSSHQHVQAGISAVFQSRTAVALRVQSLRGSALFSPGG